MKKLFFLALSLLVLSSESLYAAQSVTFSNGETWSCDQYFEAQPLRYWYNYRFHDTWNNTTASNNYLNDFAIAYTDNTYLAQGASLFDWTTLIQNANYTVTPGQSMETLTTSSDWGVVKKPTTRKTGGASDFTIGYKIWYDYSNNYPDSSDDSQHVECQPYYVTWCGDGVVDPGYETCDPAAPGYTPDTCSVTTCTPIVPPPVDGVCDPARTGVQPSPITAGACTTGSPTGFTAVGTNPANYAWNCTGNNGGSTAACTASYTPPVVPVCNPAKTGTQPAPVSSTDTLCTTGTASGFTQTASGTTTNYTWSCNASTAVNCSADYTPAVPTPFDLSIKKYISSGTGVELDAQSGSAVAVNVGSWFNYVIRVKNEGTGATYGVTTMKDILPAGVTLSGTVTGSGWICTASGQTVSCTTGAIIAAGAYFPDIIVPVRVTTLAYITANATSQYIPKNAKAVTVGNFNIKANGITQITSIDIARTGLGNTGSVEKLQLSYAGQAFSATVSSIAGGYRMTFTTPITLSGDVSFDLSVSMDSGANEQHMFALVNVALSNGIINGLPNTIGVLNTTTAVVTSGDGYRTEPLPETASPIRLGSPVVSTIVNNALVHNPNESNPCNTDGSMPAGDESTCAKDPKNVDPAYIIVTSPGVPLLTIRKFAKGIDSQTQSGQVVIGSGEVYPYTFVVTNSGTAVALGARVIDTLPAGIEIIGTPTGTGWACTMSGQTMDCMYDTAIAIGATAPTITAQARIRASVAAGTSIRNVAAVCARDPSKPATDPANACVPDPVLCKIGDLNYNPVTQQCDPATVVLTGTGFDLSIKKYISTGATFENDAQIGSGVTLTSGLAMNYVIRVKNEGPQTTTGTTTVRDTLPTGVVGSGAVTGALWICTSSGADISCATTQVVASGSTFTDIIVPVRITAGASATVTNYAVVYNPDELNPCLTGGTMPVGNETTCTKDPKNIDPAQFTIPGGGSNGSIYYTPTCTNSVRSCSTVSAASQPVGSYTTLAECNTKNTIACGPGPGGSSGNPGRCGDGILGSSSGEECDLPGATWCGQAGTANACKIVLDTTPGANPISLKLRIPALGTVGSATFGTSIPVSAHRVVIGGQTSVFTLADEVSIDIDTLFDIPVMIPADRLFCLQATGDAVENNTLCSPISKYMSPTTVNGQSYVIIGKGSYQTRDGTTGAYSNEPVRNPVSSAKLFKGFDIYPLSNIQGQLTPRDAFRGIGEANSISRITLYNRDPIIDPTGAIDIAWFPVRVSAAMVGTTGTPVNRSVETFVNRNTRTILAEFGIGNVSGKTTTSTTTTAQATNTLGNVSLNGVFVPTSGALSVDNITQIPALNGNQAIRAIKGDLTVMCPQFGAQVFALVGVTTVIVEGNIRINCNTAYPSGDTTSSVAWIAKGGNITIDASVTNIAGVYVAIPATAGDTTTTGQFQGTSATNTILKIDGSLYGNANPLFTTRLYARGTSAYDILTTGTIITYSNRALVNPPPLLSQYLGNYSVERVVK